jgi:hypothetical protein
MTGEEFVRALYRGLLGREPDPEGFAHHVATLAQGGVGAPADMIRGFVDSPEFRVGHASADLTAVLQVQPSGPAFAHVASLGADCYVSKTLKAMRLKRYSLPFDWIFSSPDMVAHCIANDFGQFLDPRNYRPNPPERRPSADEGLCEHLFYRDTFGVERVFNHFDPTGLPHHAYLVRAVARFRRLLQSAERKLFLAVVPSLRPDELAEPFARLALALEERSVNVQLEMVALLPASGADEFRYQPVLRQEPHSLAAFQPLSTMQALLFGDMLDELFLRRLIARHVFTLAAGV